MMTTIDGSLFEVYLGWLEPQVGVDQQSRSYSDLIQLLGTKEFLWLIPHDDNRIVDGLEVRQEFYEETGLIGELGPCSVLEVLVALSRRLAFVADGSESGWAWQLICNLELDKYKNPIGPRQAISVDTTLEILVWRTYSEDGQGGFFPLAWPEQDQRDVELWYQMSFYADEIHPEY
jgi:hypothetical protein